MEIASYVPFVLDDCCALTSFSRGQAEKSIEVGVKEPLQLIILLVVKDVKQEKEALKQAADARGNKSDLV